MTTDILPAGLQPAEPGYLKALRLTAALRWAPLLVAALVADRLLLDQMPVAGLLPVLVGLAAIGAVMIAPARVYRRLGYSIDERLLRVVRGWLFHADTIVPLIRVQHIDVTRGPIDKLFGLASLVVHTAGTHNSIVVLPGLAPDRAAAMRETIRGSIRADAE